MGFVPFPELTTARLLLREIVPADLDAFVAIQNDPEVTRYFGRAPLTREQCAARLAEVETSIREGTAIRWALIPRDGDALIGSAGFWKRDLAHHHAELGYELARAWWGRGLMAEALEAIVAFGFGAMGLHRVEANTDPANVGSMRVLEKVGFVREGTLRENWHHDGRYTDTATFGLLARDLEG
jgi:[ribosomal protein S5]-alanine N-acetyltransferase